MQYQEKYEALIFMILLQKLRCVHLKFGWGKARGHKKKIVNFIKKIFMGVENYDIKEHFLLKKIISNIIGYPTIKP